MRYNGGVENTRCIFQVVKYKRYRGDDAVDGKCVLDFVKCRWQTVPDLPWGDPDSAVLRHADNRKWYALLMRLPASRLGLDSPEPVEVLNLKCDPVLIGSLRGQNGVYPAYHMNREHWISVLLRDAPEALVCELIEMSFALTAPKRPRVALDKHPSGGV